MSMEWDTALEIGKEIKECCLKGRRVTRFRKFVTRFHTNSTRSDDKITKSGHSELPQITAFIRNVLKPISILSEKKDLSRLMAANGGQALVGHFKVNFNIKTEDFLLFRKYGS